MADNLQASTLNLSGDASIGGDLGLAGNLNVSGEATLSSLTVTGDAQFKGNLTVTGLLNVQDIQVNGHILTKGDTPDIAVLVAAGSSATATVEGNDISGKITIVIGDGNPSMPNIGELAKLTFKRAYAKEPRIQITPVGPKSAALGAYVEQTTDDFTIGSLGAPHTAETYTFNYQIMQ
jgi:cytoskeletal protein CcmA (bactofilin family)